MPAPLKVHGEELVLEFVFLLYKRTPLPEMHQRRPPFSEPCRERGATVFCRGQRRRSGRRECHDGHSALLWQDELRWGYFFPPGLSPQLPSSSVVATPQSPP